MSAAAPRRRRSRAPAVAPQPDRPPALLEEGEQRVVALLRHHFGSPPKSIVHEGSGLSNLVYRVEHAEGAFVVRLCPDPARLPAFLKEQWAMTQARKAGIPVPDVLEVGSDVVSQPYMVSRQVEGREATGHPERASILHRMGELARRIHGIRTRGFGHTFDWSDNRLSRCASWAEYLREELDAEGRVALLARHRMLSESALRRLRAGVRELATLRGRPALAHGDLRLKNVIVDEAGKITAVLDWEHCLSSLPPYWDASLALHDLSVDEKQIWLEGYGLPQRRIVAIAPALRTLNLLNYAPAVAQLAAARDRAGLERYRTRLAGALDLYAH